MNEVYEQRMKQMLGDEFEMYLESMNSEPDRGLRINLLKTDENELFQLVNLDKEKTTFAENEYYLKNAPAIGKSIAHAAGLFYVQEPSASAVVPLLDVKPGLKVLDLCAAPGSKSTEILERMNHEGLLVANEINTKRVKILKENIIRFGASNAIVINAEPKQVAHAFGTFFDLVLVDAPCSGEGMMRKNSDALKQWTLDNVMLCAERQKQILEQAYKCLKPGGTMVYSTCTFAMEENEENIVWFLKQHEDMSIVPINVEYGRPGFDIGMNTSKCRRIFPMDHGEGHFMCKMMKAINADSQEPSLNILKSSDLPKCVRSFLKENIKKEFSYYYLYKDRLYGGNFPFINPEGCKIVNHQVYLGSIHKDRFEPSHDLAINAYTGLKNEFEVSDEMAIKFLKGETLTADIQKGYYTITWHHHPLGFVKSDGKILKNHYPKELRIR